MQSTAEIPLTRGYVALIDEADYEAVTGAGAWCANTSSADHVVYAQRGFRGADGLQRTVQMHRFLTGWDVVDHRNGNGLDNRRSNLRPATIAQNAMNRRRRADNTSGFKGVSFRKETEVWRAYVSVLGKRVWLGQYRTAIEAAAAYDVAAKLHYGEFARLNFPEATN
jgi:hypothetical protein